MRRTLLNPMQLALLAAGGALLVVPVAEAAGPLAQLPQPNYTSWIRVVIVLVAIVPWLLFCQWVDKDAAFVRRMNREMWNLVVLGGGVAGLVVWLFMPWTTPGLFAAGFGLWLVITAGACSVYVVLRNAQVDAPSRVFTPRHISTWFSSLGKKKQQKLDAVERVKITAHDGAKVPPPEDPTQTDAYEATQNLLFDALWRRATDAEMLISANGVRLAYRIDGVVTARNDILTKEAAEAAMVFIKRVAGLDVEERRRPQTGELMAAITGGAGGATEIEVQTSGTTQHERLAMKIIGAEHRLRLGDIGLTQPQREAFDEIIKKDGGLILVSGPKTSGVTTTLYAALRSHDAFMQNLLTLEVNPLMELENITQHVFDSGKHEANYARQLQTVLRREPDVVMVSDCMDRETAHLAVTAARGGKRIYMGMPAKDSFDALKKLISLAGDTDAVAQALLGITSQRLIRKLCIACRIAYKPDAQLLRKANLPLDKIEHFYRVPRPEECVDEKGNPKVCPNCQGSGYFFRTGIFEVLVVNDAIRELIKAGQPVNMIRAAARKNGMLYLQEVGLQKVIEGVTSMNEMLRVLREEEGRPGQ